MPELTFTPAQTDAIEADGTNLIVSAAAGSGKTAVLTERIARNVLSGKTDLARTVIVTYTRAAAAELKSKLSKKLDAYSASDKSGIASSQLLALSDAKIGTVHSFLLSVLRENRKKALLPPSFGILEEHESEKMLLEASHEAAEEFFETPSPAKDTVYETFSAARTDGALFGAAIKTVKKARTMPDGFDGLFDALENLIKQTEASPDAAAEWWLFDKAAALSGFARDLGFLAAEAEKYGVFTNAYIDTVCRLRDFARSVADKIVAGENPACLPDDAELLSARLPSVKGAALPAELRIKDAVSSLKTKIRETVKFLDGHISDLRNGREYLENYFPAVTEFLRFARLTGEKYAAAKKKAGVIDYPDIERISLSVLTEKKNGVYEKSELAKKLTREIDAVYVDEYQDSNTIQDIIFRAVSNGENLFIVGDPKQSIYSFTGSEPDVFIKKRNGAPEYKKGTLSKENTVILPNNFRCDRPVIETVNFIFGEIMDKDKKDSLYGEKDRLVFSKTGETSLFPVEFAFCDIENGDGAGDDLLYVAARIRSILAGEIKKPDGTLFAPCDIAVLLRQNNQVKKAKEVLSSFGIPVEKDVSDGIFTSPAFFFYSSVIEAASDPSEDIPFAAVMLSDAVGFTEDDLLAVRYFSGNKNIPLFDSVTLFAKNAPDSGLCRKIKEFLHTLSAVRYKRRYLAADEFLWFLRDAFLAGEVYSEKEDAEAFSFILKTAQSVASRNGSVSDLSFLLEKAREKPPAKAFSDPETDGVRVMTMHKSKGLEFEVVFIAGSTHPFSADSRFEDSVLYISAERSVAMRTYDKKRGALYGNPFYSAQKAEKSAAQRLEEERLLYVAMTRARQKLIVAGTLPSKTFLDSVLFDTKFSRAKKDAGFASAKSFSEMIILALQGEPGLVSVFDDKATRKTEFFTVSVIKTLPEEKRPAATEEKASEKPDYDALFEVIDSKYGENGIVTLPEKLSVSELVRYGETSDDGLFPAPLSFAASGGVPASFIGTSMHKAMQFIRYDLAEKDINEAVADLADRGFLTEKEISVLDRQKLSAFFSSPLYALMKKSPRVEREKRFNVILDALPLIGKEGDAVVQGVTDVFFENSLGGITLLDFKTDRVPAGKEGRDILTSRHSPQLRLYARAAEEITGKKVTDIFIYSFALSEAVKVKEPDKNGWTE